MDQAVKPTYGKYYVTTPLIAFILRILDFCLAPLKPSISNIKVNSKPKSILISNMGGYGDVIISTAVIPVLRSAFPGVKIGMLVSKRSSPLLLNNHNIDHLFELEQWFDSRSEKNLIFYFFRNIIEYFKLTAQIRHVSFDIALELFPRIQNTIPMIWLAGIPIRIGYTSGGFSPLLTHRLELIFTEEHVINWHFRLLCVLSITEQDIAKAKVTLAQFNNEEFTNLYFEETRQKELNYIILHISANDSIKGWSSSKWRELTIKLIKDGYYVVFTGYGCNDYQEISKVIHGLDHCVNMSGKVGIPGYLGAIRSAKMVVCVDTIAQHASSAFNVPCVVIMTGRSPHMWYPMHKRHRVVINPVECIPCYRNSGCKGMECILGVEVNQVYAACLELMGVEWSTI